MSVKKELELEKARSVREKEDLNKSLDREGHRLHDLEAQLGRKNEVSTHSPKPH